LLDTATGDQITAFIPPDWSNGEVAYMGAMNLTLSPDGALFGIYDGLVRLLPVDAATETPTDLDRDVIEAFVTALDFSPDSQNLIVGDGDGNLQMWNVETLERTSFIRGEQRSTSSNQVNDVLFAADNSVVYTAESDPHAVVRAFSAETLTTVNALDFGPSTSAAVALALSPDGTQLAVVVNETVRIIDTATFSQVAQLVLRLN
jgi:WD40 repeat protein